MPRLGVVCGCVAISRSDEIDKYSHVWPVFVLFCEALDPGVWFPAGSRCPAVKVAPGSLQAKPTKTPRRTREEINMEELRVLG